MAWKRDRHTIVQTCFFTDWTAVGAFLQVEKPTTAFMLSSIKTITGAAASHGHAMCQQLIIFETPQGEHDIHYESGRT